MKLAIMQPYFLPYIGYFSLIKHTDLFILFDTPQYIRHGWIERNRVLKHNSDWLYVKVPLIKTSRDMKIKDALIDDSTDWRSKILSQLQPYKRSAPYYRDVIGLIAKIFEEQCSSITELDKKLLESICEYLGISTPIEVFSEMGLDVRPANEPDEWALNICTAIGGVDEYWNPPNGKSFFDKRKYDDKGISLKFLQSNLSHYEQKKEKFEPGLSIIDVMMFNSVDKINVMLDDYELI